MMDDDDQKEIDDPQLPETTIDLFKHAVETLVKCGATLPIDITRLHLKACQPRHATS
jgi:hypothetical protein